MTNRQFLNDIIAEIKDSVGNAETINNMNCCEIEQELTKIELWLHKKMFEYRQKFICFDENIVTIIIQFTEIKTVYGALSLVCKKWRKVCYNDKTKRIILQNYGLKINKNQPITKNLLINCEALAKCDKIPQEFKYCIQCACRIYDCNQSMWVHQDLDWTIIFLTVNGFCYQFTVGLELITCWTITDGMLHRLHLHCETKKDDRRVYDIYPKYNEIQINEIVPEFANKQGEDVKCVVQFIPDAVHWQPLYMEAKLPQLVTKKGNQIECFIQFCADFTGQSVVFGSDNYIEEYLIRSKNKH